MGTSISEELKEYASGCISGKIPSCQKHKWACVRFLSDIKKIGSKDFPYVWSEEEAQKIVNWFALLRHSKGVLAKKPIILNTWQKFNLCQVYGWRHKESGYKRFNKSFTEVARKNAKSQMEAGVILYEISTQATKNGEVYEAYTAGVKRDQSKIIYNEAKLMLRGSPLSTKFKIGRDRIVHRKTDSFLQALSKEDGKSGDGTNPAILVLDEYHQHQTTEFYALGMGSNTKESLLMIITTAGMNLTYPCYTQEYKYCSKVLNPDVDVENDEYFIDICELEDGDDLNDESLWLKANPIRATYPEGLKKIRDEYRIAKEIPEKLPETLTKLFNVWQQARENGYMNMAEWKKCEVKSIPYDLTGRSVYVGFDMSSKIDLTSVAFIIPIKDGDIVKYVCFSHSFIPNREKLAERTLKDRVPYEAWERGGFLTVTNTPIVNQSAVMKYVLDVVEKNKWQIECLCFDPANASKIMMDLSDEGYEVEEVYQSHKSLNEATEGYREQVYSGNVIYIYNPLLNFAMSNAVIRRSNGLIKIDKDATKEKIDPVDAMLAAYKLALYHVFIDTSVADGWLDNDEF